MTDQGEMIYSTDRPFDVPDTYLADMISWHGAEKAAADLEGEANYEAAHTDRNWASARVEAMLRRAARRVREMGKPTTDPVDTAAAEHHRLVGTPAYRAYVDAYDTAAEAADPERHDLEAVAIYAGLAAALPHLAEQWRRGPDVCGNRPGPLLLPEPRPDHVHACGRIPDHRHPEHACHGCQMTWTPGSELAECGCRLADVVAAENGETR